MFSVIVWFVEFSLFVFFQCHYFGVVCACNKREEKKTLNNKEHSRCFQIEDIVFFIKCIEKLVSWQSIHELNYCITNQIDTVTKTNQNKKRSVIDQSWDVYWLNLSLKTCIQVKSIGTIFFFFVMTSCSLNSITCIEIFSNEVSALIEFENVFLIAIRLLPSSSLCLDRTGTDFLIWIGRKRILKCSSPSEKLLMVH